ncbi:hypothetical protein [Streptococcus dentiloxodontae]
MGKIGKGCLGCLGVFIAIFIIGIGAVIFFAYGLASDMGYSTPTIISTIINKTTGNKTEFKQTDTSDETIRSIKTYGDYIKMYQYIMEDYQNYYEDKLSEYGVIDNETKEEFENSKSSIDYEFELAEREYGGMTDIPLSDDINKKFADYLIAYRDTLHQTVDKIFNNLGGI